MVDLKKGKHIQEMHHFNLFILKQLIISYYLLHFLYLYLETMQLVYL
jgi:hypothetical protein